MSHFESFYESFWVILIRLYDKINGGERGIRTLETVSRLHAFQACAFNHSATSPYSTFKAAIKAS